MTHRHVCFAIDSIVENRTFIFIVENEKERCLTKEEAIEITKDLKSRGFDVLPACNNIDARGHCLGHEDGDESHGWEMKLRRQKSLESFPSEEETKKGRGAFIEWRKDDTH